MHPAGQGGKSASAWPRSLTHQTATGKLSCANDPAGLNHKLRPQIITLPPTERVQLALNRIVTGDIVVSIVSLEQDPEMLLTYLAGGDIRLAGVIGDEVVEAGLRSPDQVSPVACAIAGYYLLRTAEPDRLQAWLDGPCRRYDWLPDIVVMNAWWALRAGAGVEVFRKHLLETVHSGLPVYAEGVRRIILGCRMLLARSDGGDTDIELSSAHASLERYAHAMDWSRLLTTFSGVRPELPLSDVGPEEGS
jgi:hypothetical protein